MPDSSVSPVIEVRGLEVRLGNHLILDQVNFSVAAGQLVALIGPNGAGKTTLLRCLLGLQTYTGGAIRLFGETDLRRALPRIGYVPQRLNLERSFVLSVREFLALRLPQTRHWFWRSHRYIDRTIHQTLPELGVDRLLNHTVAHLSGGELQRVLIAFSLLRNPELLLLDEPTAGVDTPGEVTFYDLIADVQRRCKITVVLVSHDLSMVYRHASHVFALNRTVCCEGTPEEIMNAESLKQAYGIHVSPYQHHHSHSHSHDHSGPGHVH